MGVPPPQAAAGPPPIRICAFIDGHNLFNWAKRCFGYRFPNYDIAKLVQFIVDLESDRQLTSTHFYAGIPTAIDDQQNHEWWRRKFAALGRQGIKVEHRFLKRRELTIKLAGIVFFETTVPRLQEKGIDLKLGLDLVRKARSKEYDTAILFSQDADLVEAVVEVYDIAKEQKRRVTIECAYPVSPGVDSRPIKRTVPRQITRATYDGCIDPTDYRK